MLAEPRQTRLDRGRLKLGGDHASWYGGVVNVDYRRQITFDSVADDHFLRDTASHPQGKLDSNAGSPIQGLRFLAGLRLAAGGLVAVSVELSCIMENSMLQTTNLNPWTSSSGLK